jgi:hypothetical protein
MRYYHTGTLATAFVAAFLVSPFSALALNIKLHPIRFPPPPKLSLPKLPNCGGAICGALKNAPKAVGTAVQQTTTAVGVAVDQTGRAVGTAAQQTTTAVGVAVDQTGRAVGTAVDQAVKAAVIATQQTGHAIENAAHDTGHGVAQVGKFAKDHPWETVVAVALIAGGGYLIVYEGYALSVTIEGVEVVSVTPGATGVVVGGAAAVAGAGTIAYGTIETPIGPTVSTIGGEGSPSQPVPIQDGPSSPAHASSDSTAANTQSTLPPADSNISLNALTNEAAALEPTIESVQLPKNASNVERLGYAIWASEWAEKTAPIAAFDPTKSPAVTPAELKLLDAIVSLRAITSAPEDEQAAEQHDERSNPLSSAIKDNLKDLLKDVGWRVIFRLPIGDLFTLAGRIEALRSQIYKAALAPTATTELIGQSRDALLEKLQNQLDAYLRKRDPQSFTRAPAVPSNLTPQGPTIEPARP